MAQVLLFTFITLHIMLLLNLVSAGKSIDDISGISGAELTPEYDKLNNYLVDSSPKGVSTDKFELVLERWTRHENRKWFSRSKKQKAEQLFLALRKLEELSSCNRVGRTILRENNLAMNGRPTRELQFHGSVPRVIEKVFRESLKKHAQLCQNIYPATFKEKLSTIDGETLKRVADFADALVQHYVPNKSLSEVKRLFLFIQNKPFIDGNYVSGQLEEMLKDKPELEAIQLQPNERLGKLELNNAEYERVYNEYIIEPCKYFVQTLGPDIFEPATFVKEFLEADENNLEYFQAWARYRVCEDALDAARSNLDEAKDLTLDDSDDYFR